MNTRKYPQNVRKTIKRIQRQPDYQRAHAENLAQRRTVEAALAELNKVKPAVPPGSDAATKHGLMADFIAKNPQWAADKAELIAKLTKLQAAHTFATTTLVAQVA